MVKVCRLVQRLDSTVKNNGRTSWAKKKVYTKLTHHNPKAPMIEKLRHKDEKINCVATVRRYVLLWATHPSMDKIEKHDIRYIVVRTVIRQEP